MSYVIRTECKFVLVPRRGEISIDREYSCTWKSPSAAECTCTQLSVKTQVHFDTVCHREPSV